MGKAMRRHRTGEGFERLGRVLAVLFLLATPAFAEDCVILLHGFMGDAEEMSDLQSALDREGYKTVNDGYPSTEAGIEVLAAKYIPPMIEKCGDARSINFVTHSMGGLLLRRYLYVNIIDNIGRAVMLAPPNHGSEMADEVAPMWISQQLAFPSLSDLQTKRVQELPLATDFNFDVGIIAGSSSVNPIGSYFLPGPDDGYVALENVKLDSMKDFYVVPTSHGLITTNETAIAQTVYFLKTGYFDHSIEAKGYWLTTEKLEEFACYFARNSDYCKEE